MTDKEFPYVQGSSYQQKLVRETLGLNPMYGINPKEESDMIVLFRSVPDSRFPQSNVYLDKFDEESGIYRYTGAGRTGDQTMYGGNASLRDAKDSGSSIHLFWQHREGDEHEYVGKVNVQEVSIEKQPDQNNKMRNVYVFSLKPDDLSTNNSFNTSEDLPKQIEFCVNEKPPKHGWCDNASGVIKLRQAAFDARKNAGINKAASEPVYTGPVKLDFTIYAPNIDDKNKKQTGDDDPNKFVGDLDNFIAGMCDYLGKGPNKENKFDPKAFNDKLHIAPDKPLIIYDDSQIVEINARKKEDANIHYCVKVIPL